MGMNAAPRTDHLEEALSYFEEFLRKKGFKITQTRLRIAERALSATGHFSAMDLWDSLGDRRASIATVYRTLELLEEAGLVRRCVFAGSSGAIYESYLGKRRGHGHLICQSCGRVIEFQSAAIEEELRRIAEAHGFCLQEVVIQGIGLCRDCRASRG